MGQSEDAPTQKPQAKSARNCAYCNLRFKPKRDKQVYCSELCRRRANAISRTITTPVLTDRRCDWCGKRLDSKNPKARFCDSSCRLAAFKAKPCIYCGAPATSRDHFIPQAFARRVEDFAHVKKRKLIVPACGECNSTAGDKVFFTLKEKRQYIAGQYKKKYKKFLDAPGWTEDEISEMGYSLQSHVRRDQELKRFIKKRISRLSR